MARSRRKRGILGGSFSKGADNERGQKTNKTKRINILFYATRRLVCLLCELIQQLCTRYSQRQKLININKLKSSNIY